MKLETFSYQSEVHPKKRRTLHHYQGLISHHLQTLPPKDLENSPSLPCHSLISLS